MKSVLKRLKQNKSLCLTSQSGQGILEYILVLVVTVALILGLMWQFSDAFRAWANNYFGEYLACLLETGELPSIGGGSGVCNQYFEPFSLAAGRPLKPPGGQDGGGGYNPQSSGRGSSSRNNNVAYSGRVGGGGGSGGGMRFRSNFSGDIAGSNAGSSRVAAGKEEKIYTGSTESSMPASIYNNSPENQRIKVRQLDRAFGFQQEKPEGEKTETRITVKKENKNIREEKKRMLVKRKLAASEEVEVDGDMSFGDFFRILVIAAIIIALLVFLGGQALQIGKSME